MLMIVGLIVLVAGLVSILRKDIKISNDLKLITIFGYKGTVTTELFFGPEINTMGGWKKNVIALILVAGGVALVYTGSQLLGVVTIF